MIQSNPIKNLNEQLRAPHQNIVLQVNLSKVSLIIFKIKNILVLQKYYLLIKNPHNFRITFSYFLILLFKKNFFRNRKQLFNINKKKTLFNLDKGEYPVKLF